MKSSDFETLTIFEKAVILLLEKILKAVSIPE
jgi:hypothetical protein